MTRSSMNVPQPPYPVELIADLHADNLPPAVESRLWPLVRRDPDAVEVLHALDRVTDRLRALGTESSGETAIPADIAARLNNALHLPTLEQHSVPVATVHQLPVHPIEPDPLPVAGAQYSPHDPALADTYADFGDRYRRRRRVLFASAVAATAAAAVVAVTVSTVALRHSEPAAPAVALPAHDTSDTSVVDLGNDLTPATLLSALGRHDEHGLTSDKAMLGECLAASGIDASRPLLGSTSVRFHGKDGVLLLVAGPHTPQITALVVGPTCNAAQPQVMAKTDIG